MRLFAIIKWVNVASWQIYERVLGKCQRCSVQSFKGSTCLAKYENVYLDGTLGDLVQGLLDSEKCVCSQCCVTLTTPALAIGFSRQIRIKTGFESHPLLLKWEGNCLSYFLLLWRDTTTRTTYRIKSVLGYSFRGWAHDCLGRQYGRQVGRQTQRWSSRGELTCSSTNVRQRELTGDGGPFGNTSGTPPPTRSCLLSLPKQFRQLMIENLNIQICKWGLFSLKTPG